MQLFDMFMLLIGCRTIYHHKNQIIGSNTFQGDLFFAVNNGKRGLLLTKW